MHKAQQLLVALDYSDPRKALKLVATLAPLGVGFKVGLQLFLSGGEPLVRELALKHRVFLDLKFHDIPNTVAAAVTETASLGVWMLNIHAAGGRDMMLAAVKAAGKFKPKPLIVAVTMLTSLDKNDLSETGCSGDPAERVALLSRLAHESFLDGVVCSPLEIEIVKKTVSSRFITVTPGVRPAGENRNDQARTAAPAEVIRNGGDYLVVGRPITAAADPFEAAVKILSEMGADV